MVCLKPSLFSKYKVMLLLCHLRVKLNSKFRLCLTLIGCYWSHDLNALCWLAVICEQRNFGVNHVYNTCTAGAMYKAENIVTKCCEGKWTKWDKFSNCQMDHLQGSGTGLSTESWGWVHEHRRVQTTYCDQKVNGCIFKPLCTHKNELIWSTLKCHWSFFAIFAIIYFILLKC